MFTIGPWQPEIKLRKRWFSRNATINVFFVIMIGCYYVINVHRKALFKSTNCCAWVKKTENSIMVWKQNDCCTFSIFPYFPYTLLFNHWVFCFFCIVFEHNRLIPLPICKQSPNRLLLDIIFNSKISRAEEENVTMTWLNINESNKSKDKETEKRKWLIYWKQNWVCLRKSSVTFLNTQFYFRTFKNHIHAAWIMHSIFPQNQCSIAVHTRIKVFYKYQMEKVFFLVLQSFTSVRKPESGF